LIAVVIIVIVAVVVVIFVVAVLGEKRRKKDVPRSRAKEVKSRYLAYNGLYTTVLVRGS
jgi:uncharacterized membrane protein